jgi:hypothetical protein
MGRDSSRLFTPVNLGPFSSSGLDDRVSASTLTNGAYLVSVATTNTATLFRLVRH